MYVNVDVEVCFWDVFNELSYADKYDLLVNMLQEDDKLFSEAMNIIIDTEDDRFLTLNDCFAPEKLHERMKQYMEDNYE